MVRTRHFFGLTGRQVERKQESSKISEKQEGAKEKKLPVPPPPPLLVL